MIKTHFYGQCHHQIGDWFLQTMTRQFRVAYVVQYFIIFTDSQFQQIYYNYNL